MAKFQGCPKFVQRRTVRSVGSTPRRSCTGIVYTLDLNIGSRRRQAEEDVSPLPRVLACIPQSDTFGGEDKETHIGRGESLHQ